MIVKIKTYKRPTFSYLLGYMVNKDERLFDRNGRSFVITHNVKGKTVEAWTKQFQENELYRKRKRKNSVYLNHEIISWHRDDVKNLSVEKMRDMVRTYLKLRNKNGMYVAVPHFDRDHFHVHICSSAIEYRTGKSMRMSHKEFNQLKQNLQQYQIEKFPELTKSIVRHGRKGKRIVSDKERHYKTRTGKQTKLEELQSIVKSCSLNTPSQEEFFARLKGCKLQTYVRGKRVYGIIYENKKYRFRRLGIDLEKFEPRQKAKQREKELQGLRKQRKIIGKEKLI